MPRALKIGGVAVAGTTLVAYACVASSAAAAPAARTARAGIGRGDPVAGSWEATGGKLSIGREAPVAAALPGGRVLAAGGDTAEFGHGTANPSAYRRSAEVYDSHSGSWTPTAPMTTARSRAIAAALPGGRVLVAGGRNATGDLVSAEIYDSGSGTWTATGSMNAVRQAPTATRLPGGRVLVAGGAGPGYLASAEVYDPASGKWTPTGNMATAREFATAAALPDGRVLVAGGFDGVGLDSAEIWDPASGKWTLNGNMTTAREGAAAAPLPGGRLLVAGGDDGSGGDIVASLLDSAEIYDPAKDTWAPTADMTTARDSAYAIALPSGRVLVAGGIAPSGYLRSAEVYDPHTDTWTPTARMITGGQFGSAAPLPAGRVLVVGGLNNSAGVLASAQVFTPTTSTRTAIRIASRTLHHQRVRLKLRCTGAPHCNGKIRLKAHLRGRHAHQVGHRRYSIHRGRHTIGVRLGHRARRRLHRRGHLRVMAIATLRGGHKTSRDTRTLRRHQLAHIHPVTRREAKRVKDKHLAELRARYNGFLGIGIGVVPGNSTPQPGEAVHILVIYLESESELPSSPQSIAGVPIRFIVTGPIRAQ